MILIRGCQSRSAIITCIPPDSDMTGNLHLPRPLLDLARYFGGSSRGWLANAAARDFLYLNRSEDPSCASRGVVSLLSPQRRRSLLHDRVRFFSPLLPSINVRAIPWLTGSERPGCRPTLDFPSTYILATNRRFPKSESTLCHPLQSVIDFLIAPGLGSTELRCRCPTSLKTRLLSNNCWPKISPTMGPRTGSPTNSAQTLKSKRAQ